jgi:hypothetical protein
MSDYTPFPNEDYPDTSPEANACANYLYTIRAGTHPAIVAGEKAYKEALCDTGYFCCGEGSACDCDYREQYFQCYDPPYIASEWKEGCASGSYGTKGDDGCLAWWSPWWTIPPCGVDPVRKAYEDTMEPINKAREEAVGREARIKLAGNCALSLSNTRLSTIFYNSMLDSAESILVGMTNTFLQAGAIAGAVAGASQIFASTINYYTSLANAFIQSFQPYNPPPIGGGGGLS